MKNNHHMINRLILIDPIQNSVVVASFSCLGVALEKSMTFKLNINSMGPMKEGETEREME